MKKVTVETGPDGIIASSTDDCGKQLGFYWEIGLLLTAAVDKMIIEGISKNEIVEVMKYTYDQRCQV